MATVVECISCGKVIRLASTNGVGSIACPKCGHDIEVNPGAPAATPPMARHCLTIIAGPANIGHRASLPRRGRLAIGSHKTAWLHLDNASIDAVHCLLTCEKPDDGWTIVNRSNQKGLQLNGKNTDQNAIGCGDVLEIGPYQLRFEKLTAAKTRRPSASGSHAALRPAASASGSHTGVHPASSGSHSGVQASASGSHTGVHAPPCEFEERMANMQFPKLVANRLTHASFAIIFCALLGAAHGTMTLFERNIPEQSAMYPSIVRVVAGAAPGLIMLQLALLMATPGEWRQRIAIGGIAVLAIVGCFLGIPADFILRGMLAGGVALMVLDTTSALAVAAGAVIAWTAVGCYGIAVILCALDLIC